MDMEGSQKAAQCCALADNHHNILETNLENAFQIFSRVFTEHCSGSNTFTFSLK